MRWRASLVLLSAALALGSVEARSGSAARGPYDILIRGGIIVDGRGGPPVVGDVGIVGDKVAYVGPQAPASGQTVIDARGKAVSPGFINMLSWAADALMADGRGQSDIRQGVTLEVFGEGWSMGPVSPAMTDVGPYTKASRPYAVSWSTLGEYLELLERRGVSPNIASFVGATTVRQHELGDADVDPTPEQLDRMRALVRKAMREGAMGVGSSLVYVPAKFAETPELVALASEAGACGGMYISHVRDEGSGLLPAVDELIEISRRSGAPAEIYHLKQAGKENWGKLDALVAKVEAARAQGLRITADMYSFTAAGANLASHLPDWVQAGGPTAQFERLRDPAVRARAAAEIAQANPGKTYEDTVILGVDDIAPARDPFAGKRLSDIARERGVSPTTALVDILGEAQADMTAIYFTISEDNLRRQLKLPWVSISSDAPSVSAEGEFLKVNYHPRTYGNFARLLGSYVRDQKVLTLQEAVRRMTSLPASNLGLKARGVLAVGAFADVVVFDPATIRDHATYEKPHQYATGVSEVLINGVPVIRNGRHTGAKPGRVVRGPGWTGWPDGGRCPG